VAREAAAKWHPRFRQLTTFGADFFEGKRAASFWHDKCENG
jgi:hypothetical protein